MDYMEMKMMSAQKMMLLGGPWDGQELPDMGAAELICWDGHVRHTYEISKDRKMANFVSSIDTAPNS